MRADITAVNAQQPSERVPRSAGHHESQLTQHGGCEPPDHSCEPAHRVCAPLHLQLHTIMRERQGKHSVSCAAGVLHEHGSHSNHNSCRAAESPLVK